VGRPGNSGVKIAARKPFSEIVHSLLVEYIGSEAIGASVIVTDQTCGETKEAVQTTDDTPHPLGKACKIQKFCAGLSLSLWREDPWGNLWQLVWR